MSPQLKPTPSVPSNTTAISIPFTEVKAMNLPVFDDKAVKFPVWKDRIITMATYYKALFMLFNDKTHDEFKSMVDNDANLSTLNNQLYLLLSIYTHQDIQSKVNVNRSGYAFLFWSALEKYYGSCTIAKQMRLDYQFQNLVMKEKESVSCYFDRLMALQSDMFAHGMEASDQKLAIKMVNGLSNHYQNVKLLIRSQIGTKTLQELRELVLEQELDIDNQKSGKVPDPIAFQGFKRRFKSKPQFKKPRQLRTCWSCGEKGHEQKDCQKWTKTPEEKVVKFKPPTGYVGLFNGTNPRDIRFVSDRSKIRFVSEGVGMPTSKVNVEGSEETSYCYFVNTSGMLYSDWYLDSGCTNHVAQNEMYLVNYKRIEPTSIKGLGGMVRAVGMGELPMKFRTSNGYHEIVLREVLHVPDSPVNLVSSIQLKMDSQIPLSIIEHDENTVWLVKRGTTNIIGCGSRADLGLYRLDVETCVHQNPTILTAVPMNVWHLRTGHTPVAKIEKMVHDHSCTGLVVAKTETKGTDLCKACLEGRMIRSSHPVRESPRKVEPFEVIHSDICGPFEVLSAGHAKYFVSFIDEYSRYVWIYTLKKKSEFIQCFKDFNEFVKVQYRTKIMKIHSDYGGEYRSNEFQTMIRSLGIVPEYSVPATPQQNGIAERMNRTLVEKVRCMLFSSGVPVSFWGEALVYSVHIVNRIPCKANMDVSPYNKLYDEVPDLSRLRVFGSHCLVYRTGKKKLSKLEPRVESGWFLGLDPWSRGFRILLESTGMVVIREDVRFEEHVLYESKGRKYNTRQGGGGAIEIVGHEGVQGDDDIFLLKDGEGTNVATDLDVSNIEESNVSGDIEESNVSGDITIRVEEPTPLYTHQIRLPNDITPIVVNSETDNPRIYANDQSSEEEDLPDVFLSPSEDSDNESIETVMETVTRSGRISRPPDRLALSVQGPNKEVSIGHEPTIPTSYEEAMSLPEASYWKAAMEDEYASLVHNNTWTLTELPKGSKVIDTRWVFTIKRNADGSIDRYKARLVAKGFTQKYGEDYFETFAPVLKMSTLRMLIAVAVMFNWKLKQFDIKTAFLNGDLVEVIYIRQPDGFVVPGQSHLVCLLGKSLYGLKQSPRQWNKKFTDVLNSAGFKRCQMDPCCYYRQSNGTTVWLLLYVDDGIVVTDSIDEYEELVKILRSAFDVKDLGDLSYILGIQVKYTENGNGVSIHQEKYLKEILEGCGMLNCKPTSTPLVPNCQLPKYNTSQDVDVTTYRSLVGKLNYAMISTRPDLAFAIGLLSRHLQFPGKEHWQALKHLLRYVKGTMELGLRYHRREGIARDIDLVGYSDASYLNEFEPKATSGWIFLIANAAICWSSKKQNITASSTMEAELVALFDASKESIWIRQLLLELEIPLRLPVVIYEDNQPGLAFLKDVGVSSKSRHIRIRYYALRDEDAFGYLRFVYCPTNDMVADMLTKSVSKDKCSVFSSGVGLTFCGMRGSVGIPTGTGHYESLSHAYVTMHNGRLR
jgi:hypothetical protein